MTPYTDAAVTEIHNEQKQQKKFSRLPALIKATQTKLQQLLQRMISVAFDQISSLPALHPDQYNTPATFFAHLSLLIPYHADITCNISYRIWHGRCLPVSGAVCSKP
ncbi:MAG: hypothetical protein WA003_16550 [Desulfuromonadaceae bacterium]